MMFEHTEEEEVLYQKIMAFGVKDVSVETEGRDDVYAKIYFDWFYKKDPSKVKTDGRHEFIYDTEEEVLEKIQAFLKEEDRSYSIVLSK